MKPSSRFSKGLNLSFDVVRREMLEMIGLVWLVLLTDCTRRGAKSEETLSSLWGRTVWSHRLMLQGSGAVGEVPRELSSSLASAMFLPGSWGAVLDNTPHHLVLSILI